MDQAILVREWVVAGAELVQRVRASMPVSTAFWLKEIDEPRWYLYLGSDTMQEGVSGEAYKLVREAIEAMGDEPGLDLFQVKVVPASHPFAREASDAVRLSARNAPVRLGTSFFGGRMVEGLYVYPAAVLDPVAS